MISVAEFYMDMLTLRNFYSRSPLTSSVLIGSQPLSTKVQTHEADAQQKHSLTCWFRFPVNNSFQLSLRSFFHCSFEHSDAIRQYRQRKPQYAIC